MLIPTGFGRGLFMPAPKDGFINKAGLKQGIILFSFFAITIPVFFAGILSLLYQQRSTYPETNQEYIQWILLLALISVALLLVLFVIYINSRVIKPIVAISTASQSVIDGSFTALPENRSRFNELQELTTNFNAMVAAIALRESELQDKNMELEQEIEERARIEEALQERNEVLASIEEELRTQVDEHIQTREQLLVTEEMLRIQLESAEESSLKFKAVFDHSPITVALTTLPDGAFHEVNQAFIDMFGFAREDAIGKTTLELGVWLHEADRNRYLQLLKENRFVSNFEVTMRRKGGEKFAVFFSGALLDIAGKPFALSAVMDISEQKRLQNQLAQSQKLDIVGQLAGGIAHDFNNMLAVIMASAEILKLCLPSDEKNHKMINAIIEAANRSADLTSELLTFSRKGTTVVSPVRINDTIIAVISLLERTIDKQIQLKTLLDGDNPVVMGDQTQLQSALLNLGINARDAMPQGGVLTYSTAGKSLDEAECRSMGISLSPGYYLEIMVSDSGAGMTKAVMERIFEPFFTTKAVGKGTGLGLAAVYGTVRSHLGEMHVHSEPGVGSVFKIFLPMAEGEIDIPLGSSEVPGGNGGILLVDDEEILREVGRELLENLGYRVFLAENGVHAIEVFVANQGDISLVVLDMIMPKMGGMETLLKLREQAPEVKVLLCSGFSHEGTGDELIGLGATGFIQKPYSLSLFSRAVADAIG